MSIEEGDPDTHLEFSDEIVGPRWKARQLLPVLDEDLAKRLPTTPSQVLKSWPTDFHLREESESIRGLRRPQVGAVHALLGYWTTDPRLPATVVMPTGTGKTDTMIAAFVAIQAERLLVVVPSDALRDQLTAKFERLGVLPTAHLLSRTALMPVVGKLLGSLSNDADATALGETSNVVISTVSALTHTADSVREVFLSHFTHLFIDEAHHVAANTWRRIRDDFAPKPVVQFTATPHRTDGKHLGGNLVYAFPLREAQRQGYFSKIRYQSVLDLLDPDRAIATAAVNYLHADLNKGLDHLLMARVKSIRRAEELAELYAELAPKLGPIVVHSKTGKTATAIAMQRLESRKSRILICVDMFGEGFDLAQLKIAALHDQHRSLGITLQFVGRFARSAGKDLGEATVVAARSEVRHDESLRRLYAEDADWNMIVEDLSNESVEEQSQINEFTKAFGSLPDQISIHSLVPAMSTVMFRPTTLTWRPSRVIDTFPEEKLLTYPVPTNERDHLLWFVTQERTTPKWGILDGVDAVVHHLYVVYWNADLGLLFINSSNNDSTHDLLARSISGDSDAVPLSGESIFRVFHGVERLTPTNVGLLDARNRSRRYSNHVGSDVTEAFPIAEAQTKSQTHIAGTGYLNGSRHSIAGSLKGRVWSHRTSSGLKQWAEWCDEVGAKVVDATINVDAVMAGFIRPEELNEWPDLHPLGIELPSELTEVLQDSDLIFNGVAVHFHDAEFVVGKIRSETELEFCIQTNQWIAPFILELSASGLVVRDDGHRSRVLVARSRSDVAFSALASRHGVRVLMSSDSIVEPPGFLLRPNRTIDPWPPDRLKALDWSGVNIRAESWGVQRDLRTVQGRMIDLTLKEDWDIVIDDDGPGEVADIVALREIDGALLVRLIHCKYSSQDRPGARVSDLYELSGQAQRSAGWRRDVDLLIPRLIKRERTRAQKNKSGFVRGDIEDLQRMFERSIYLKPSMQIAIAQPGISAKLASVNVLELLASVDLYTSETAMSTLEVFCSA